MGCNESNSSWKTVADVAVAIAAGLLALGGMGLFSSSSNKKTMKAPGRNYRIFRDDFERDPSSYFRNLRK
ncbi:hypothetical protein ERO13_A12G159750v2 [Gossypium hirsutum]|uniref:Uncharacterized protein n=4 Tax=Gossypium TaxID=3633 RepID=A0A5J5TCB8_GOSBA|nr:hypothetical protein ES319_A12G168900v1 [Gossypium barbadense]KAG4170646.1 hypothetical protein ERO13_A12G159750v2 [Gossypium hirsutum]TYG90477.1 hypothetical protein ES288_A12G185200v1 [Gossypium darwinii]TYH96537.1 hypothetical protein ES332_A12G184000v1 [Gossypium tomentosum]TYJ05577.1 hypothetical protein E1A91_A12G172900v1 [Gossypium mustelinum]